MKVTCLPICTDQGFCLHYDVVLRISTPFVLVWLSTGGEYYFKFLSSSYHYLFIAQYMFTPRTTVYLSYITVIVFLLCSFQWVCIQSEERGRESTTVSVGSRCVNIYRSSYSRRCLPPLSLVFSSLPVLLTNEQSEIHA